MYVVKPKGFLGFTAQLCNQCKKITAHYLLSGDNCVVKLCVACYQTRLGNED